ncbi:MAG: phosphoadenylyl-sulfate reductase [Planctomycetota bacterium]
MAQSPAPILSDAGGPGEPPETVNPEWPEARVAEASRQLEAESPLAILEWATRHFQYPRLCSSTSFQPAGIALLHMSMKINPALPVYFVDTGFHFPETLAYRDQIVNLLGINLITLMPAMAQADFGARYGLDLHDRDPDTCCAINKVEPMRRALENHDAWIASLRRDGGAARKNTPILQRLLTGVIKIHPLAKYRREQVMLYLRGNNLPAHPLIDRGYKTIGCRPLSCTRPVAAGEDERAGRWVGRSKDECGLHTFGVGGSADGAGSVQSASKSQALKALDNIEGGAGI